MFYSESEQLTKQRPCECTVLYALAAEIQHQRQPLLAVGVTVEGNTETVVLRVEDDGMPVSGIGLGVDAETVLEHDAALRRHARLELLLAVKILEACRPGAALFTENKQLLLICLK